MRVSEKNSGSATLGIVYEIVHIKLLKSSFITNVHISFSGKLRKALKILIDSFAHSKISFNFWLDPDPE
jgi:hypothetical protein